MLTLRANRFKVGQQIIYVPEHAHETLAHPHCQHGFITSIHPDGVFCRYWRPDSLLEGGTPELRTVTYSEKTPEHYLYSKRSVGGSVIAEWFQEEYGIDSEADPGTRTRPDCQAWLERIECGLTTQDDADMARDLLHELAEVKLAVASALLLAEDTLASTKLRALTTELIRDIY